jgi:hypothetical protein
MPNAGQCLRTIERIENASARAATARLRLSQLEAMLRNLARRGAISEYNVKTAIGDIEEVRAVLRSLQDDLCSFRG